VYHLDGKSLITVKIVKVANMFPELRVKNVEVGGLLAHRFHRSVRVTEVESTAPDELETYQMVGVFPGNRLVS
jgi:hypothetical protein